VGVVVDVGHVHVDAAPRAFHGLLRAVDLEAVPLGGFPHVGDGAADADRRRFAFTPHDLPLVGRHLVPAAVGALLADRSRTYPADFFSFSLGLGLGLALVLASPGFPSSVLGNSWHSRVLGE
jgi:hypothetical protein